MRGVCCCGCPGGNQFLPAGGLVFSNGAVLPQRRLPRGRHQYIFLAHRTKRADFPGGPLGGGASHKVPHHLDHGQAVAGHQVHALFWTHGARWAALHNLHHVLKSGEAWLLAFLPW